MLAAKLFHQNTCCFLSREASHLCYYQLLANRDVYSRGAFNRGGRLLKKKLKIGGTYSRGGVKKKGAFNRSITVYLHYRSKSVWDDSKFRRAFMLKALNNMHLILSYQIKEPTITMKFISQ